MLTKLLASINASLKAHSAGLGAAVTLLLADLDSGNAVTLHQWVAIVGAYLGVGAAVHVIPNLPKAAAAEDLEPGLLGDLSHGLSGDAEPQPADGE